jgi:CBS domain-containing protein
MGRAADIMVPAVKIRGSATVAEAISLMKTQNCRSLIVNQRTAQDAYGIITETDIIYKVVAFGKDPQLVRVYEIMTKPCIVVNPDLEIEYVARLFANYALTQAPVIQGKLLGVISASDILFKGELVDHPQQVQLQQQLHQAIQHAQTLCEEQGLHSEACAIAWDEADALESELAHQQARGVLKTAFEEYCEEFPELAEARVMENLCSG